MILRSLMELHLALQMTNISANYHATRAPVSSDLVYISFTITFNTASFYLHPFSSVRVTVSKHCHSPGRTPEDLSEFSPKFSKKLFTVSLEVQNRRL